jgi:mannosyl-3-phosphoglycerate phosphatase
VSRLVVFSDVDGSLLDSETYSFEAASRALRELALRKVPLVLCSSKTRSELARLRRRLRNRHPFIVENGGGIVIPAGYFGRHKAQRIDLGRPYPEITAALDSLAEESGIQVRGFHHLTAREVSEKTGLPLEDARLARKREYDEPFFFVRERAEDRSRFLRLARRRGFDVAKGGRFWHFFSGSDKGAAVRRLMSLYRRKAGVWRSAALGDAANDLPMLHAVDRAVLLPAPDGTFDRALLRRLTPTAVKGSAPGPEGWNEAVLSLLAQCVR